MDEEPLASTMRAIEDYLARHPDSADSLDGIHVFWIGSPHTMALTCLALEHLCQLGVLESVCYGHNSTIWRRCRPSEGGDDWAG